MNVSENMFAKSDGEIIEFCRHGSRLFAMIWNLSIIRELASCQDAVEFEGKKDVLP